MLLSIVVGSLGDYDPAFLGSLPDGYPPGAVVDEGLFSVTIDENRAVAGDNNFIAVIRYTGNHVNVFFMDLISNRFTLVSDTGDDGFPSVESIDGSSGRIPILSVVEFEGEIYLKLENELDFENGGQWLVRLAPPLPEPVAFSVIVSDVNDQ